jgi:nucleotide-binding universal stress UspA family protein
MTIICATRFTEESSFAVKVAAELARRHKEQLWLVHVLPNTIVSSWGNRVEIATASSLDAEASALKQSLGLNVETAVLHGKLETALSRFCKEKKASLLVVGDTAQRVGPVLAGTLDKLAYNVETALLVVRNPEPWDAWAKGKAPLKVMLAIDHTSSSAVARDWIATLGQYGAIDLVATHVWWPTEEYERRRLPVPPPEEGHLGLSRTMKTETEAALAGLPANVKTRVHLEMGTGRVGEQLLALANEEQVDLFVLGTHRRRALGRLWSVSHHVMGLAPMSVACIPGTVAVPDGQSLPSFSTALAATDLTEAGNRAITCALGVVGHGTVYAVHVSPEKLSAAEEKALLKKLAAVLPADAERNGAKVVVSVRQGDVAAELLRASQELEANVICLGAKATSLRSPLFQAIILGAAKPVLLTAAAEK